MHEFKYTDDSGNDLNLLPSEGVTIIDQFGNRITIRGRRTDGHIEVYCDHKLVVEPRAANLIYVRAER